MTVTSILKIKGRDVLSIDPAASLAEAAKLMVAHHVGALLVRGAGGRLSGILSERDIVHALAARGADALEDPVHRVMTRDVVTCGENDEIGSIMERMTSGKFRHVPVLRDGELVGIVSIGDVVKDRLAAMERETEAMRGYIQTA